MPPIAYLAAVLLAGTKPSVTCPRPILINVNLNHPIDRGVFKRTFMNCRREYKKSPCLIKLVQPEKGAFHAICGEPHPGAVGGFILEGNLDQIPNEVIYTANCSAKIFSLALAADWSTYQTYPVVAETQSTFCEAFDLNPITSR